MLSSKQQIKSPIPGCLQNLMRPRSISVVFICRCEVEQGRIGSIPVLAQSDIQTPGWTGENQNATNSARNVEEK